MVSAEMNMCFACAASTWKPGLQSVPRKSCAEPCQARSGATASDLDCASMSEPDKNDGGCQQSSGGCGVGRDGWFLPG